MTNEEAVKVIKSECYVANLMNLDRTRMVNSALDVAIQALEQTELNPSYNSVKTGLEQTRWIPCSERLPMAFEFVNCTCHSLIDDREDWVIETVYVPQPSNSPYSDWGNIPMLNSGDCKVVAWIHRDIPEPYKAESEEAK